MSPRPQPGCTAATSAADIGWHDDAACRDSDPDLWFAPEVERERDRQRREARAKRICSSCPVTEACLEWRLGFEHQMDAGVWGGKNEDERHMIRRKRVRAAAAELRRAS